MQKEEVLTQLEIWKNECYDSELSLKDIIYKDTSFETLALGKLNFKSLAESQLLLKLNIPGAYFHRCPPTLREQNFNTWAKHPKYAEKPVVLRCKTCLVVRGVVSTKYNKNMDDINSIPIVLDASHLMPKEIGEPDIRAFNKQEHFTVLEITYPLLSVVDGPIHATAGIILVNSEVGISCLRISPFIIAYEDGVYYDLFTKTGINFYHTKKLSVEDLQKSIINTVDLSQKALGSLLASAKKQLRNPGEIVQKVLKDVPEIPKRMLHLLEEEWKSKQETNRLAFVQSILRKCNDLPVYQAYLASAAAGQFLDVFPSPRAEIRDIINGFAEMEEDEEEVYQGD